MNIKLVSVVAALAVSAAVAQDYDDDDEMDSSEETTQTTSSEEPAEEPAREEASAPAAPAIEETSSATTEKAEEAAPASAPMVEAKGLNVLHGNAYNMVGNQAAASTIGGDMFYLYNMAGRTLIYVDASSESGVLSVTKGSTTFLAAFENTVATGILTAGIANKGFGAALHLSLDKTWDSDETGQNKNDVSTTGIGDDIGATFSMPLGELDFAARADWYTYANDVDEDNGTETDRSRWELHLAAEISNSPSGKDMFWAGGLSLNRHANSTEVGSNERIGNDARTTITPHFNLGFPLVGAEDARLYAGLNTSVPIVLYDEIEDKGNQLKDSYSNFGLVTKPNIFGEYAVNENWIVFGGATFSWNVFGYAGETIENTGAGGGSRDLSSITMKTNQTYASGGARFQYNRLVLEASIADNLGTAAWSGLIGNFGAFINF